MKQICETKIMEKNKATYKIILVFIIAVQVCVTIYMFWHQDGEYFSDEIWSYGLSNSYYRPFFSMREGVNLTYEGMVEDYIGNDEWMSGDVLRDYITVGADERFTYGSVYYNNVYDVHPPLYYMLLHTVCSLFPDQFSWWYGLSLNLIFLVGTQVFLYLTVNKITSSKHMGVIVCGLYAVCKSTMFIYTFIRQYALLIMLCMGFVYFSTCLYEEVYKLGRLKKKTLLACAVSACLAFLTHYYGIFFIGIFTACQCVDMLLRKKCKEMFAYGFSILAALGVMVIIWPSIYVHVFAYKDQIEEFCYRPATQVRMLLHDLIYYNLGFETSIFPTAFWNVMIPLVLAAIVATAVLLFPFRKEPWFIEFADKLVKLIKRDLALIKDFVRKANYIPLFSFVCSVAVIELVAHTIDVFLSGHIVMRYIFLIMPFLCMIIVIWLGALLQRINREKTIGMLIVMVTAIAMGRAWLTTGTLINQGTYGLAEDVSAMVKGKNVLIVDADITAYPRNSAFWTAYMKDVDRICFSTGQTLPQCMSSKDFDSYQVDYIFIDTRCYALSKRENSAFIAMLQGNTSIENAEISEEDAEETENVDAFAAYIRESVNKINGGDSECEFIGAMYGQMGFYYILKL